jgi:hypothetical protein
MKKIVIILFFFIVSISVFAQDKSLFFGNFSLTERTKFLGASTVKNRSQNWGDVYNLIYVQRKNISSEEKPGSLAEGYLRRLAERSKKIRKTRSAVGFIGGGICLGIGAAVISSVDEYGGFWEGFGEALAGAMLMGVGTVGVIGGTLSLVIPFSAEREHKDVLRISDLAQRERASHEALSSLAARAKTWRIVIGAAFAAAAVSLFIENKKLSNFQESSFVPATYAGLAAYSFLRKTLAERTYQNYLKEKEYRKELALRIGIMPYGGVKIDLAFSF